MLVSVFLVLFLPCAGISVVFIVYVCLLWYAAVGGGGAAVGEGVPEGKGGLSAADLGKIPKVAGKDLVLGNECAVCLDEIGEEQVARLVPGCNHGFHVECADAWLSKHPACPLCRARVGPEFFSAGEDSPC